MGRPQIFPTSTKFMGMHTLPISESDLEARIEPTGCYHVLYGFFRYSVIGNLSHWLSPFMPMGFENKKPEPSCFQMIRVCYLCLPKINYLYTPISILRDRD